MRVLHAIHDYLPRHRAGSELYVEALCRAQRPGHEPGVLCAEYDAGRAHLSLHERRWDGVEVLELVNNWRFGDLHETWGSPQVASRLDQALERWAPDVLHVHNLLNLSFELPVLARRRGAAVVGTLHDYTLVCPSGGQRVHLEEQHLCREIEAERCARCFAGSPWFRTMAAGGGLVSRLLRRRRRGVRPPQPAELVARLQSARRVLECFDRLVAPSASLAEEYRRLGAPADRLEVSDYGFAAPATAPRAPRGERLRIGYAGTPGWHKGVHVLLEAVGRLPEGRWQLDVWGDLEVAPDYARRLRHLAGRGPVRFRGAFDRAGAPAAYAAMDVLVVPSLWLENSPLVVHEAFQAGVPVVASRIGGLPELVPHERCGLLFAPGSAAELADALGRLIAEPALLEGLAAALPTVKAIERDAAQWDERYAAALARLRGEPA